jgi:hypothetical protein
MGNGATKQVVLIGWQKSQPVGTVVFQGVGLILASCWLSVQNRALVVCQAEWGMINAYKLSTSVVQMQEISNMVVAHKCYK